MTIQLIHVSDIHFGSGEGHGRINPQTGLNIRFEDFVGSLSKTVDYAIEHKIDVFLFSGDAYKTASPEPIYQKMFAQQLKRLSNAEIKTILLVGNHDQILRSSSSHALSVFQSLEVPRVTTIDNPMSCRIDTTNGAMQLIGIPHVTRHQLMVQDKYSQLSPAMIDSALVEQTTSLLKSYYEQLDPALPTVVTAHMTIDRAVAGIEQELLVGYTLTFPTSIFVDPRIDYVALGHVHRHQIIRPRSPLIAYSGSLERVDFGEQNEDKGFLHVQLERNNTSLKFVSTNPRPFVTVEADLTNDINPTATLCNLITQQARPGCVLRVRYKIRHDQLSQLNENEIRATGKHALSIRFQQEIELDQNRSRLPELTESAVSAPLAALDTYLQNVPTERKSKLLQRAQEIMSELQSTN